MTASCTELTTRSRRLAGGLGSPRRRLFAPQPRDQSDRPATRPIDPLPDEKGECRGGSAVTRLRRTRRRRLVCPISHHRCPPPIGRPDRGALARPGHEAPARPHLGVPARPDPAGPGRPAHGEPGSRRPVSASRTPELRAAAPPNSLKAFDSSWFVSPLAGVWSRSSSVQMRRRLGGFDEPERILARKTASEDRRQPMAKQVIVYTQPG